jgi:hypothetical protein
MSESETRKIVKKLNSKIQNFETIVRNLNQISINANTKVQMAKIRALENHRNEILKLTKQIHNAFKRRN